MELEIEVFDDVMHVSRNWSFSLKPVYYGGKKEELLLPLLFLEMANQCLNLIDTLSAFPCVTEYCQQWKMQINITSVAAAVVWRQFIGESKAGFLQKLARLLKI